ncbi:MAG: hypothetical protein KDD08_04255, partial [Mangrovimonas sp.]|nr:hypothetical protein [Mangrovimonas sp.]
MRKIDSFKIFNLRPRYIKLTSALLMLLVGFMGFSQVRVPFNPRASVYSPSKTIYNIKGDFTMIGNTNLTLVNYGNSTNNSNNDMRYVDVDNDINTLNSSSATLSFSTENGAIPDCSKILYAGLYWTGRAGSENTFTVNKEVPTGNYSTQEVTDTNQQIYDNDLIPNTNYSLDISSSGNSSNWALTYTFTSSGAGNTVVFVYRSNNTLTVSVNGGTPTNVSTSSINSDNAYLSTPYQIFSDSNYTLEVARLRRQNTDRAYVNIIYNETVPETTTITKNYNKRKVSIKGPGATNYTEITAGANDIYYPTNSTTYSDGYMYSAYAEITQYVIDNGLGEYFLADMALVEGDGGSTGYYGGWGMVVVYENSKMKWRDVTVFDGHAYVIGDTADHTIDVSGFKAVQNGDVHIKIGMMAGEGDVGITGDYFQILRQSDNTFQNLSHSGNSTTNFFNSSIVTGGNTRNPNLQNNTGLDISMFDITNTNNSIITNNQTSTQFHYGSTQDTYVIFNVTFAVDAYIPDIEGEVNPITINSVPTMSPPYVVEPGQEISYTLEIKNKGTEETNNTVIALPIPYTSTYQDLSISYNVYPPFSTSNVPYFNPSLGATGSIVWELGTLPVPSDPNTVLADITFTLVATTDCNILTNPCGSVVALDGTISGTGSTSGTTFSQELIQGFETTGVCVGEPIATPLNIVIDSTDYVQNNCSGFNAVRDFYFCNIGTNPIPISEVQAEFPVGTQFFNEYPVDDDSV